MYKYIGKLMLISCVCSVYADPFSIQPQQQNQKQNTIMSAIPSPPKAMSPSNFKSEVKSQGTQARSSLQQEANQIISAFPKPQAQASAPDSATPPSSNGTDSTATTNQKQDQSNNITPVTPNISSTSTSDDDSTTTAIPPATNRGVTQPGSGATSTPKSQAYTGFGGSSGSNNSSAPTGQSGSGSGWNVKY